ncbi:hypothetical protein K470DRAFT_212400 [Piedraia hortae CBS 480.64]|uniref:60S ribosomal protein L6 n=1 Tax=Piedraia hortae CBS 480.64 TaxID=1314780 RepID=A0A6A7C5B6_9PEZI|nr:hypothetical protein K470DRAFT_212400 [Piedraia hortae CBS 480.64]
MSATTAKPQTKKFQKGERTVPHHSEKASKHYLAHDVAQRKKARKSIRPYKPRASLQPGAVLIILAGRFRGKRVVLLKVLDQGILLVTGPFKVNGVPLRRVNARYVIATSTTVPLTGLDSKVIEKAGGPDYFKRDKKADKKGSEEAFFKHAKGEKGSKKEISTERAEDQKKVDDAVIKAIKKEAMLHQYMKTSFCLRNGDRPHAMVF